MSVSARRGVSQSIFSGHNALLVLMWVLVGTPLALLIAVSLNVGDSDIWPNRLGFDNYVEAFSSVDWLVNTLLLGVGVAVITTVMGVILAWVLVRTDLRSKRWLSLLVILPYPMGPMVAAIAWATLGANDGLINIALNYISGGDAAAVSTYNMVGVIIVQSLFQIPVTYMVVEAALSSMDASLEEASAVSGAGTLRTAKNVTVPLMTPSVVSAGLFAFVSALGAFAVPTVLGTNAGFEVATTRVYRLARSFPLDYPLSAAIGVIMVVISTLAVIASQWVLQRRTYVIVGGKGAHHAPITTGRARYVYGAFPWMYVAIGVFLPLAALVVSSLQRGRFINSADFSWTLAHFKYVLFEYQPTSSAIYNSLLVGAVTAIVGVLMALAIALVIERRRLLHKSSRLLEQVTMTPQAVPRIIFALPLLWIFVLLPVPLFGTLFGIGLAYIIVFAPLALRTVSGVVGQVDTQLEEAAMVFGAPRWRVLPEIRMPLMVPGLVAAMGLVFMISISEVGASVLLQGTNSRVLGPMLLSFYGSGGLSAVCALALIQAVVVLIVVAGLRRLGGRWTV